MRRILRIVSFAFIASILIATPLTARAQSGHTLTAVGPVNQAMGGACVAHPQDATGALYWNPASITAFKGGQFSAGVDLFVPSSTLSSTVNANALGPGFPPITLSGSTDAKRKVTPIPSGGLVYHRDGSRVAYGLGVYAIAGFGVEYNQDPTNPILSPQPAGLGHLKSQYSAIEVAPTIAFELTKHLSVGIAPEIVRHSLLLEPFLLQTKGNFLGTGPIYEPGEHKDASWGVGVQVGVYYRADNGLELGASYKSPKHFQDLKFDGYAGRLVFPLSYPEIVNFGAGYAGRGRLGLALDVRHIRYNDLKGFEMLGFGPGRQIRALDWRSIWATATGVNYALSSSMKLRGGYSYSQSPIEGDVTVFNVASPTIIKHKASGGVSIAVTEDWTFNATYTHSFGHDVTGPLFGPGTPTQLGTVTNKISSNGYLVGIQKKW